MRWIAGFFALVFWCLPAERAGAAEPAAPVIRPPAAWVTPLTVPPAASEGADKPLQLLLVNTQSHYGADGVSEYFVEVATKVQTPQGLTAIGNVVIPWQPELSELIVHKVALLRDGKAIDLLAGGQGFTVLRRENNLESAMLDGVLTAVLQPEGLSVGDVVNVAWTIRTKPRAVAFKAENLTSLPMPPFAARHAYYRELWDKGLDLRWRATPAMGKPKLKTGSNGTELLLDLPNAVAPKAPERAPSRYQFLASLEVSGYRDWGEIGRLLAPLYAAGAQLAPTSPLKAEIARIAAASQSPEARAMAALRLVQEKVRYLALAMGEGGYAPASADQTWARKFGDCKGKTVPLLALLKGLGIEAEPVLVNSRIGDSLSDRLPMVRLFDHVILRARIGGKSYYLDGTRIGDRRLADLASSPFGYGLPVTETGSALEKLPLLPPSRPLNEANITYDASNGFEGEVPVTGEIVYRGDMAAMMRLALAQGNKDEFLTNMKSAIPGVAAESIAQADMKSDEESDEVILSFSGKTPLEWSRVPGTALVRHRFDDDVIQWTPDFERTADQAAQDAPFAFDFPFYQTMTETIILPKGGAGFTLEGKDLVQTVAGVEISRKLSLEGGRAVARSSFRRLQAEVPATEAKAAKPVLETVNGDRAWVRSPAGYKPSESKAVADAVKDPKTAQDYLARAYTRMQSGKKSEALADFDKAAELAPNWSLPYSNRAMLLIQEEKYAEAKASLEKAARLGDEDFVTWQGYGLIHLKENRPGEAVESFTRALALDADNLFSLVQRAHAYEQLGQLAEAAADMEHIAKIAPDMHALLPERIRIEAQRGNQAQALALADKTIEALGEGPFGPRLYKAQLLKRFGRSEEAQRSLTEILAGLDKAIASASPSQKNGLKLLRIDALAESGQLGPALAELSTLITEHPADAQYLNKSCWMRATANSELEAALADCEKSIRLKPNSPATLDSRAFVKLRLGRLDESIADYGEALRLAPDQAASLYGRGIARLRKGQKEDGERDLATARRIAFDIDSQYKAYGIAP